MKILCVSMFLLLFLIFILLDYVIKIVLLISAVVICVKVFAILSITDKPKETPIMDNVDNTKDNIPSIFINKDILKPILPSLMNTDEKKNKKMYIVNRTVFEDEYNSIQQDISEYDPLNIFLINNVKDFSNSYSVNEITIEDEYNLSEWEYSEYKTHSNKEFVEFELEEVEKLTNDVKDDEYTPVPEDLEDLAITHLESTFSGVIINYEVYLSNFQWHTLIILYNDLINCLVCDAYLDIDAATEHTMSKRHLNNLNAHKPLGKFELSITRRINDLYHCAVCNVTYPITEEDFHHNSTHEANLLSAMNKANDYFDINNDMPHYTDGSYADVAKRIKENESLAKKGFYDNSYNNNIAIDSPNADVTDLRDESAVKNEYNSYFKDANVGNGSPNNVGLDTGISYAAIAKSPKNACYKSSNSANYNVHVKNVDETTQDFSEYYNDKIDFNYNISDSTLGTKTEKYPSSINAYKSNYNNNDITNINKNDKRIEVHKTEMLSEKSHNIVLRKETNIAESHAALSNVNKNESAISVVDSKSTKNIFNKHEYIGRSMSNNTGAKHEYKIFNEAATPDDNLKSPNIATDKNSDRNKNQNFKLTKFEFDNSKNVHNKNNLNILNENNTFLQEILKIVVKNTEFAVDLCSYNSIAYRGDHKFCFVCSLGVYDGEVEYHIKSSGHKKNLSKYYFLDSYSQHLIRQKHPGYHCSICNVLIKTRHMATHLQWPIHQRLSAQCKSKKLLKNTSITYTLPTQEEKHLNVKAHFKVYFDVHIVATPTIDSRVVKVNIDGRILNVPHGNWHGIRHLKPVSNGFKCITCQEHFEDTGTVEKHCDVHGTSMDNILDRYLPALLRKVNENLVHCIICNKEIAYSEEQVQTHLYAKSHNRNYEKLIKGTQIET